jgi:Fe2+ or Zn2+ uptake regulation protein
MSSQAIFEKSLKQAGVSLTKPRQVVFKGLQHHKSLTMAELVAACTGVDRASVYRTTELFERLGIIIRIPNGWKYRLELGEAFHEHHHHATCSSSPPSSWSSFHSPKNKPAGSLPRREE